MSLHHRSLPLVLFLLLLISSPSILSLPSFPLSPLRGVERRKLLPDLIKPTFCPTPCEKVFGAESLETSLDHDQTAVLVPACLCVCPHDRPIYLNALGFCVERPPEQCTSAVVFDEFPLDEVPVLSIKAPEEGSPRTLNTTLSWSDEFILSSNFTPSCHISSVFVDSALSRWEEMTQMHFELTKTEYGRPRVMFNGSEEDAAVMVGAVVQLKVACRSLEARPSSPLTEEILLRPALMCITFRVEGESASAPLDLFHGDSRIQVIVLATVAVLLLFALIASGLAYFVCWKIQKRRLIGSIALQYRTHLKNNQLANGVMSPLPHHQSGHQRQSSISTGSSGGSPGAGGVVQKRRLYFSAEFFEPECLLNPPPMAEQFLHDIRRMIDMARERISARRYIPRMHPVYEEEDEGDEQLPVPKRKALDVCVTPLDNHPPPSAAEESPRSAKSTDSGRETLDSSTSSDDSASRSEEEEEEAENRTEKKDDELKESSRPRKRISAIPVAPGRSFRATKVIEPASSTVSAATPPPIPPKPAPSMIPRLGAASPKLQQRSLSTPSRPVSSQEDPPSPPSYLPGPSQRRHDRRKGYAVFPVDPMLNKSLPRRPRRAAAAEQ